MRLQTIQKAYLALAGTSIIWGTTWIGSRIAVQYVPALQVSCIRQFSAGLLFILFFKLKGMPWPSLRQLIPLFVTSFFLLMLNNGLATWSVTFITGGLAALISALSPFCVVIIEMVFYKTKNTPLTFIGLSVGLAGIFLVFHHSTMYPAGNHFIAGVVLVSLSTLAWSIGSLFVARKKIPIDPYYGMGWQMVMASAVLFLFSIGTNQHIPVGDIPLKAWAAIAYIVLAGSVFTFVCFIFSMKHLPVAIASLYAYINPLVAMLTGFLLLNEKITGTLFAGSLVTLTGVFLVNQSIKKKTPQ